jgi:ABC-2 type transport system permease protein
MNAITSSVPVTSSTHSTLAVYALEAKYEFLRVLRTPAFAAPTLLFPPMFYLLFGLLMNHGNRDAAKYLFAGYSVFGVMAPALFGFGVGLAMERERGWLALKRVMPMPPGAYLFSKMAMAMLFALIIYIVLGLMAFFFADVRLEIGQWLLLGVIAVLGVIPFCAIGLMIGSKANASASPAFVNLIYLPMAFLSGLWMPLTSLPGVFTQIAPLWPAYHLAQLALMTIGMQPWANVPVHLAWLVAFSAVCFAIARRWLVRSA